MSLLDVAILSMLPISELRGGILLGISQGLDPLFVFLVAVLSNILVVPLMFFFLDNLHKYFRRINFYRRLFDFYIEKNRHKIENKFGTKTEFLILMLFVGIPLPATGAYTGSILAWFFGIDRKVSYISIMLGVVLAGIIMTLFSIGIFSIF